MPPMSNITHISVGKPATGSPNIRVLTKVTIPKINASMQNSIPIKEDACKGAVEKGKVTVIPNAIECSKYIYDEVSRAAIRKEFDIDNKFVFHIS